MTFTGHAELAGWTPEKDERLKAMIAEGRTFGEIGTELGGRSRASVGRAVKRLGLELPPDWQRQQMMRVLGYAGNAPRAPSPTPIEPFRLEDTSAQVHGIAALEDHHCRFICNDDLAEPIYCGRKKVEGASWCAGHCLIVFQPAAERKRAA